jgi:hypothetical protein
VAIEQQQCLCAQQRWCWQQHYRLHVLVLQYSRWRTHSQYPHAGSMLVLSGNRTMAGCLRRKQHGSRIIVQVCHCARREASTQQRKHAGCLSPGLNCLLQFFGVPEAVLPVQQRPSLVLSAEAELGITAGLQDRVIQVGKSDAGVEGLGLRVQGLAFRGSPSLDTGCSAVLSCGVCRGVECCAVPCCAGVWRCCVHGF